jgi:hypothetical protein
MIKLSLKILFIEGKFKPLGSTYLPSKICMLQAICAPLQLVDFNAVGIHSSLMSCLFDGWTQQ